MAAVLELLFGQKEAKREQHGPGAVLDLTQEEDRKVTPAEAQREGATAANEVIVIDDEQSDGDECLPPMTLQRMMRYTNVLRRAEEYKTASTGKVSEAYKGLAVYYLSVAFPGLARAVAEDTLTAHGHRFFRAREHLRSVLYGDLLHPDKMAERGRMTDAELTQVVTDNLKGRGWVGDERDDMVDLTLEDEQFGRELEFTAQHDAMERYEVDRAVAEARLLEQEGGDRMKCNCCFGDYVLGALVQCSDGHVFCRGCLRRFALTRLFEEQRTTLSCMFIPTNSDAACVGHFPESQLLQVLSPNVYAKYTELQTAEALREADITGLVSCPRCPFQGIADGVPGVLKCPDCHRESCLLCRKDAHPGERCDETDADTERRRRVEEATTVAKVRMCSNPKCQKEFVKTSGCNEITCPACKTKTCYVCRKKIVGYHFCGRPLCSHKSCGKCLQFKDPDDDAAIARAAALANNQMGPGRQVDMDRLLGKVPPVPRKRKR